MGEDAVGATAVGDNLGVGGDLVQAGGIPDDRLPLIVTCYHPAVRFPGSPAPTAVEATVLAGAGPDEGWPFERSPKCPSSLTVEGFGGVELELSPWSLTSVVIRDPS